METLLIGYSGGLVRAEEAAGAKWVLKGPLVQMLAADPNRPERLYALGDGLWRSTDGGASFEKTGYDREDPGGWGAPSVLALAI